MEKLAEPTFDLTGKMAIVTGATGRLGPAICKGLGSAGAKLILIGRDAPKLVSLQHELSETKIESEYYTADLSDIDALQSVATKISAIFPTIDILVNNAYSGKTNTIESSTTEDYSDSFRIGLATPAELTRHFLPNLRNAVRNNYDASVINISSMYGVVSPDPRIYGDSGQNSPPYYSAVKAGLIHYTQYAAVHLAHEKIRVNSISPGPFPDILIRERDQAFYEQLVNKVPLGRIGVPEDLIGPVVFLASSSSRFVTGLNLVVDGGWTSW